ncbi:MAG: hypothetical protein ABR555_14330 [Pyrinomonadaceae bacterium]
MTICPCCGFKFVGALSNGCEDCGARAVGEALPRPAHELPSYGRSLILAVTGSLMVLVFVAETIIAMFQRWSGSFGFWSWVAAGETASWRLKWIAIPVSVVALWFGRKIYRSIAAMPEQFCGVTYARRGLLASATMTLVVTTLIAITIPARLRQRQMSIDAATMARFYTLDRAFFEYQQKFKTLPDRSTLKEDLAKLPDPDGSIADALHNIDPTGYQPRAEVAAVAPQKSPRLRGAVIRRASLQSVADDLQPEGVSFTSYELRLPGEDKILDTDDDWVGRDGVIVRASEISKASGGRISAAPVKP